MDPQNQHIHKQYKNSINVSERTIEGYKNKSISTDVGWQICRTAVFDLAFGTNSVEVEWFDRSDPDFLNEIRSILHEVLDYLYKQWMRS